MHDLVSATTPYQISKKFDTGVLYRKFLSQLSFLKIGAVKDIIYVRA
jgi:hypothetical protein